MKMVHSLKFLLLLCSVATWSGVRHVSCARNELVATADCVCPGETFVYECSIVGGLFTVWTGSIFESGCEITLIHREYTQNGGARAVCNSGDVVGQSIGVDNDCYRSQLSVEVSTGINGSTVECTEDDGVTTTLIGTETILISRAPFPPPTAVVLTNVERGRLTFTWTPPPLRCPSLTYNVITNNCGTCVNNSSSTNSTCTGFVAPNLCTFTVQSVICGNLASTIVTDNNQLTIPLNVPDRPRILERIPYYSDGVGILLLVNTTWNTLDPFAISDGIDVSISSYTITYSDLATGRVCSRAVVSSGSCGNGLCRHLFNTSTSECPTTSNLQISVFATNVLGNGLDSERESLGGTNTFVDVKFNSTLRAVTCDFLNQPLGTAKRCTINIAYGDSCDNELAMYSYELGTDSQLTPSEIRFFEGVSEYCFTTSATSGNRTVIVEGTFNILSVNNEMGDSTVAIVVPIILVLAVGTTATAIIAVLIWYIRKPSLVVIRFSNSDKVGSLADKIKVFKEYGVRIITINRDPTDNYLSKQPSHFFGVRSETTTNIFIKICCSKSSVEKLRQHLEFKVKGQTNVEDLESISDHQCYSNFELQVSLEDSPGSLWRVLNTLQREQIDILGLNTQSNYSKTEGYKDNFVYCKCSRFTLKKVIRGLKLAGAINVEEELHTEPSPRALQFYVRDEPGALVKALEAFEDLSINLLGLNPAFKDLIDDKHAPSGYRTIYVECDIGSERITTLTQAFQEIGIKEFSTDTMTSQGHRVIKASIVDQAGSLVQTLKLFEGVNIRSVNSYNVDSNTQLRPPLAIEYKKVQIEFRYSTTMAVEINEVVKDLHELGSLTRVDHTPPKENDGEGQHMIQFLGRHRIGTLAQALQVFIDHKLNIVNVQTEDVSENYVYVHNHVRFLATDHKESQMISKLYATGLVVEVDTFKWDEEHRQKMTKSPFQSRKGISLATNHDKETTPV